MVSSEHQHWWQQNNGCAASVRGLGALLGLGPNKGHAKNFRKFLVTDYGQVLVAVTLLAIQ